MSRPADQVNYLFRYRDLIVDTLQAHRAVISEKKFCWWGWWKRPQEDGRMEVWEAIQQTIKDDGKAIVGLYNTGNDSVHLATVTEVIKPRVSSTGGYQAILLADGEKEAVPDYYRRSSSSRAWMKLTEIGEEAIDFFGRFSFAESPPAGIYRADLLQHYRDRVITKAAELKFMDTTIWHIRPSREGDRKESLLPISGVFDAPVSRRPISCKGSVILHISDLHFATAPHRNTFVWQLESETPSAKSTLSNAIADCVGEMGIGMILVSGDLTYSGKDSEFIEARRFLEQLLIRLDLGPEHIVVIPGNHDIRWTRSEEYRDDAHIDLAPDEAKNPYKIEFFNKLYRMDPNEHLSMGRRFVLPRGRVVDVCAVNSSSLEQGAEYLAGMGRVQGEAIQQIAKELEWSETETAPSLKILMLHHHVTFTEGAENPAEFQKGFGIAINAANVQRMAAKHRVQLVLHGHKHRAFVWRSGVYHLPEHAQKHYYLGSLNIVGAGSAGSTSTEGRKNYFNTLTFENNSLRLEMYRSEDGEPFEPFSAWRAEMEIDDIGALTLGEWIKNSDDRNH